MPWIDGLPGCLRVPAFPANLYVLRDQDGLYLIDTGLFDGRAILRHALKDCGWDHLPIRGILLTHGHIDHIWNAGRLARETGAWIAGHPLDAERFSGRPEVWNIALLERLFFHLPWFEPFTPNVPVSHGDRLDLWGGLRAVHLPGHTAGHTGYFSEKHGVLFSGDLFASSTRGAILAPAAFNEDRQDLLESIRTALLLRARGMLPQHTDGELPEIHLQRLTALAHRLGISA